MATDTQKKIARALQRLAHEELATDAAPAYLRCLCLAEEFNRPAREAGCTRKEEIAAWIFSQPQARIDLHASALRRSPERHG